MGVRYVLADSTYQEQTRHLYRLDEAVRLAIPSYKGKDKLHRPAKLRYRDYKGSLQGAIALGRADRSYRWALFYGSDQPDVALCHFRGLLRV